MDSTDTTDVELPPPARRRGLVGWLYRVARLMRAVLVGFRGEPIGLRAGNLTFVTVTSLVPLAVVILSLVHQFGANRLDRLVKTFFADLLSPGGEHTVRAFFSATNASAAGGVSFVVVLISAGVLLRHLDAALNEVWAVRRQRPWLVSLALYAGVLLLAPLIIVLSLLSTEGIKHVALWLEVPLPAPVLELGAVAATTSVFSLLYKNAPHAPVSWKSAFIGGLVAALVWELARNAYAGVASLFLSASMLYGSLGVAPLFLTWVYVAWYVVLAGARLAYAVEHADFHDEFRGLLEHPRSQELIATRIAELVTRAVLQGLPGLSTRALALELRMPQQRVLEICAHLIEARLLRTSAEGVLAPAREADDLTLADISRAVGGVAQLADKEGNSRTGQFEAVAAYFGAADKLTVDKLNEITWAALVEGAGERSRKP